jgi:hypothetical protein
LHEAFPESKNSVIVLWRDWAEHVKRFVRAGHAPTNAGSLRRTWMGKLAKTFGPGSDLSRQKRMSIQILKVNAGMYKEIDWQFVERQPQ